MPTIQQLSSISTLTTSDQLVVYQTSSGDARKASLGVFLDWFESAFASPNFETQYAAPTVSGFVLTLTQSTQSIWLLLQPVNAMAAGTIVLPPSSASWDQQEIAVFSQAEISALTVSGNGASVTGAPSYLPANGSFLLRYNALQTTWFCVQSAVLPGGPTYAATSWTPQWFGPGVTGSVTFTGRVTQNGRQITNELLIEVGADPADQLVWTFGLNYVWAGIATVPYPWGGYAMCPVGLQNPPAFGALSGTAPPSFRIDMIIPGGPASLTLTSGQSIHFVFTYTV